MTEGLQQAVVKIGEAVEAGSEAARVLAGLGLWDQARIVSAQAQALHESGELVRAILNRWVKEGLVD